MIVRGVRMYGKSDLRFEEFDIGEMGEEELLARVVTDSLCMSTHKAALQGSAHRAVPDGIDRHPVVIGHEFCAVVEKVGARAATDLRVGDLFTVQPKMFLNGEIRGPGYSFAAYGGDITHIRVPREALEGNYLLPWRGAGYFHASLTEPYSCIISALRSQYHLADDHKAHVMGPRAGGCMAVLAGCGPMGIGMAQCAMAMEAEARPGLIVVTDIDAGRVARARQLLAPQNGVRVEVVDTSGTEDAPALLRGLAGGRGFDDVMVMAPVPDVIAQADAISGVDSCISFFAGPTRKDFYAPVNFYDVHYNDKHILGTSGGDVGDMREAIEKIASGAVRAEAMVTHVGGLNAVADTTLRLPSIPGGKKLIYCGVEMPLTAIDDFAALGEKDPLFARLAAICAANDGLWCLEAEEELLRGARPI